MAATTTLSLPSLALAEGPVPGRALYEEHCLKCHGAEGRGDGAAALRLKIRPRDLTLGSFKCRSTPSGSLPTDEDLSRSIAEGLRGSPMISFGKKLSRDEITAVVEYTKHLSGRFEGAPPASVVEIPALPPEGEATAEEGRQVYRALQCWKCHGTKGDGDGPMAKGLVDSWGEPIRVHDFTALGGRFKCGGEPRDLYRTLHTGISGSPMPSFSEAFLFPADGVGNLAALAEAYGGEAKAELTRYLAAQPGRGALEAMAEAERRALVERRSWALVRYLLSLTER